MVTLGLLKKTILRKSSDVIISDHGKSNYVLGVVM